MSEGAVDFYKNGPSLLNWYLPFRVVTNVQRLLAVFLAGAAILVPLFHFEPKLYQWFLLDRMRKLYRRLKEVDGALDRGLAGSRVAGLQTDVENMNQVAKMLPKRHSNLFLILVSTLNQRARFAARLVQVRSQTANAA
jgi:hypothetical protein